MKNSLYTWGLLIVLALMWGSSFILIKKGLIGLTAYELGSLRIVAASIFLLPIALNRIKRIHTRYLPALTFVGLLGSLIPSFLFSIAQTKLDSAITGILNGLVPFFTILIGLVIYKQKQTSKVFLGIAIGFIGTTVLISSGGSTFFSGINAYVFFIVGATMCYGMNLNVIKYHLSDLDAITITSIAMLIVGPIATIHLFGLTDFSNTINEPDATLPIFYVCLLGIMSTSIALILFNQLLHITNPVFTSSVTYLIPIVALGWGVADGERLFLVQYVAMVTIGLGVYIANSRAAHKNKGRIQ